MLYWLEDGKEIKEIGSRHKGFYSQGESRLSAQEIKGIRDFINGKIDNVLECEDKFFVPGWHAGDDWNGTALQVIYDKAFPKDAANSALWYGIACMECIIERNEHWYALKADFNRGFEQTVYFIKDE